MGGPWWKWLVFECRGPRRDLQFSTFRARFIRLVHMQSPLCGQSIGARE